MSLLFPYRQGRSPAPVIPLGGRTTRPRPLIDVTLVGPAGSKIVTALLDTGADDTVFSDQVAQSLGLDLSNAPQHIVAGVGSPPYVISYAQVTLRITDGKEFREWSALVGFTSAHMTHSLLGFAGCLQFFDALFHGEREEVELTVNGLYPGK
jgi:predicted aspartyl protease